MPSAAGGWASAANEARLAPRMLIASRWVLRRFLPASRAGHLLELAEEPVHHPPLPRLVGERLAHDPASQLGRQRPDLGAQRDQRLRPLGADLSLCGLGYPAGLSLSLLAHICDDLRALLLGLRAQPGRLVPVLGHLLAALAQAPAC